MAGMVGGSREQEASHPPKDSCGESSRRMRSCTHTSLAEQRGIDPDMMVTTLRGSSFVLGSENISLSGLALFPGGFFGGESLRT